jgi:phosphotransferase system enzyme I (PtsI)
VSAADGANVRHGVGISPGAAAGPIFFFKSYVRNVPRRSLKGAQLEAEIDRLRRALEGAEEEFRRQRDQFSETFSGDEKNIFAAHLQFYQDDLLREAIEKRIRDEGLNAEAAIHDEIGHFAALLSQTDSLFRERVADLKDVGNRILRFLLRQEQASLESGTEPVVLYARELLPSDTLGIDRDRLLAIVTEVGGEASHVAILARAFGIPAVTGIQRLEQEVGPGTQVAVDGSRGRFIISPSPQQRSALTRARESYLEQRRHLLESSSAHDLEDAAGIKVLLNIENFDALDPQILATTQGVGLYRTEFLFMGREAFPSEEEQYQFYRGVLDRMQGREVIFRTIDVGGDKPLSYLSVPQESNPVLGWRGIRLTFEWPDLLIPQLRALLRASAHGRLKIMLPMVTNVEEVREVAKLVHRLRDDLVREQVPCNNPELGVMIEVPAAAIAAEDLAREVDFLSVGTNDLLQYLFAVDRNNLRVSKLYQPLHPVMLRLLGDVFAGARRQGKEVTVCGEMAGQPLCALALLGLGLRRFSMSPAHVPEARWILQLFSVEEAERIVQELLVLTTENEIDHGLRQAVEKRAGNVRLNFLSNH